MWNPFRAYREREALERQREREMFLEALRETLANSSKNNDVVLEQTRMMRTFFDNFIVTDAPSRRVMDDESEYEAALLRSPLKVYDGN
jgi:hypothetical protein